MSQTTWGTSARSAGEIRKGDSFFARTFHIGHLVLWYGILAGGLAYFLFYHFKSPLYLLVIILPLFVSLCLYVDLGATLKHLLCSFRRRPTAEDVESPEFQEGKATPETPSEPS